MWSYGTCTVYCTHTILVIKVSELRFNIELCCSSIFFTVTYSSQCIDLLPKLQNLVYRFMVGHVSSYLFPRMGQQYRLPPSSNKHKTKKAELGCQNESTLSNKVLKICSINSWKQKELLIRLLSRSSNESLCLFRVVLLRRDLQHPGFVKVFHYRHAQLQFSSNLV